MKKNILFVLLAISSCYGGYYSYINFNEQPYFALIFACGLILGFSIMNIWVFFKNNKINKYRRALEKEVISSSENSSKVKILESKIDVLEKALQEALNK